MKVGELIDLLRRCDAEAEVVITTQPNYPMEHAVGGVAVRASLPDDAGGDGASHAIERVGAAPSDVILVEGRWLRYGELAAWDAARRR